MQNINTCFKKERKKRKEEEEKMETDSCAQSIPARRNIKNLDNENMAFCSEARCGFVNFLIRELLLIDVLLAHL